MSAWIENLRERWGRMNPREQGLVLALSATLVVCIIVAMVAKIQSGMADLEESNDESRQALRALATYRNAKARVGSLSSDIDIPDKALALDTYLEKIISKMELTSPTYPALKENTIGKHLELSFEISLKGLDIVQMTDLLEKVETGSKLVVIKELNIDRNFRDKEKLDLQFTLATYQKVTKEEEGTKKDEGEES